MDIFLFNLYINPGRSPCFYSPFTDWEMELEALRSHITGLGFVSLSPINCKASALSLDHKLKGL